MSTPFDQLRNIAWRALDGAHRVHALGGAAARRYADGFAPIAAVADPSRPDLAALRALVAPGQTLYLAGVECRRWPGFELLLETEVEQMACDAAPPPLTDIAGMAIRRLGAADGPAIQDLVARTRPGPFGPRSIELGDFLGIHAGNRLVAMAGLRMASGCWREVSGVCTDPEYQGRGLAGALLRRMQDNASKHGLRLFLHVDTGNDRARRLYRHLNFVPVRKERLFAMRRSADGLVSAPGPAAPC